jgi:hypothetical protein
MQIFTFQENHFLAFDISTNWNRNFLNVLFLISLLIFFGQDRVILTYHYEIILFKLTTGMEQLATIL